MTIVESATLVAFMFCFGMFVVAALPVLASAVVALQMEPTEADSSWLELIDKLTDEDLQTLAEDAARLLRDGYSDLDGVLGDIDGEDLELNADLILDDDNA